ncbi:MAG: Mur ligase domain-containing protein, partial [Amaricoccus sp.]
MGFDALGLLTGTRRGGDWSGALPEITGLSVDSRDTEAGHLFAALPGTRMHGADFIPFALRMGAVAVLT